ncbi:hypothetical protein K470DRAFT_256476 [Piedraia hortae CBS 480.64]|uniref:purine-nucleoside phosphorylase n=1 Tax=Piedraia hortae CBS 480.64 TaxID=1314780 RepID=A0A6A7C4G3_9PEZI|nr:hypothetical protein K470DRAFT_256476 [Piedraia hortae CBS 480.64]
MLEILHHLTSLYHSFSHLSHAMDDAHQESNVQAYKVQETVDFLRSHLPERLARPRVAVVCGSGLGGLADVLDMEPEGQSWPYSSIPNFPVSSVSGHQGKLLFGTMGTQKVPVVLFVGRVHFYEGHDLAVITFATRICCAIGVKTLVLTNAAGGLDPSYSVGDIVLLNDHINLAGLAGFHPLRGPNDDELGPRFPPLSDAYDLSLRMLAHDVWNRLRSEKPSNRRLHEGVYAFAAGPTYETRAECRMLRTLGADVVGMSTVPEIIVARHGGMRVLAFSLVTNIANQEPTQRADDPKLKGLSPAELDTFLRQGRADHEEVLEAGRLAALDMQDLVLRLVSEL